MSKFESAVCLDVVTSMTALQREVKSEASADFGQLRGVPPIVCTFVGLVGRRALGVS
ncbi:MAG: hypothetical protein ACTS44_00565 [Candidatus Hodgkinia cicadicola]